MILPQLRRFNFYPQPSQASRLRPLRALPPFPIVKLGKTHRHANDGMMKMELGYTGWGSPQSRK
jgi:hypothetical protein